MPLYDFKCSSGHITEIFCSMEERKNHTNCSCGSVMTQMLSRPRIIVDNTGYQCPITEKWIGSKHAHEENLKVHDCRVLESGEREESVRRKTAENDALDAAMERTVEKTIMEMPSAKRESLYSEMTRGGADIEFIRK